MDRSINSLKNLYIRLEKIVKDVQERYVVEFQKRCFLPLEPLNNFLQVVVIPVLQNNFYQQTPLEYNLFLTQQN
jgi:hypothetical protein